MDKKIDASPFGAKLREFGNDARGVAAASAFPAVSALFSFAVSTVSPALGALPVGTSLVSASPSLATALPIFAGALLGSLRLGAKAVLYASVLTLTLLLRLALGLTGAVKVSPVDSRYFGERRRRGSYTVSASYIKLNSAFNSPPSVRVATAAGAAALSGFLNITTGTNVWYDVFGTVFGVTISPLLCFGFLSFADPDANPAMRRAGAGTLLYVLIYSISGLSLGGIKIAYVISFAASLAAGQSLGIAEGALIGCFAGAALPPGVFGIFPVAAICSGAVGNISSGAATVAGSVLGMSFSLFANGVSAISTTLPEIMIAGSLFYPAARFGLIPDGDSLFAAAPRAAALGASPAVGDRLRDLSVAMERMSRVFKNLSEKLKKPGCAETVQLCEGAFYKYCDVCRKRAICHARESFESGGATRRVASALSESGRVDISSFPETMARGCPSVDSIIKEINLSFASLIEGAIRGDKVSVIASDYASISKLISSAVDSALTEGTRNDSLSQALEEKLSGAGITYESLGVYGVKRPRVYVRGFTVKDLTCGAVDLRRMAEEAVKCPLSAPEMSIEYDKLNMFSECAKRISARHGAYSSEGRYGEENGDVIRNFSGADGEFYFLICDGMGSGREAALTSKVSSLFLERMVGAGCGEAEALSMLNDFTKERRIECSSTVDLLRIDPFCGEAVFFKSGAAPSFVLRDGKLFKIECESAPLGILDRVIAKSVNFKLRRGDVIIMLSDGAIPDGNSEAWLYEYLSEGVRFSGDLPSAAKDIATAAARRAKSPDDTTVGIVRIEAA